MKLGGFLTPSLGETDNLEKAQSSHRQAHDCYLELNQARLTSHVAGWPDDCWERVRGVVGLGGGANIQAEAAASLHGLDARLQKTFPKGASTVVFEEKRDGVSFGGTTSFLRPPAEQGRIWDRNRDESVGSKVVGDGPVAFRTDGTPLQLVPQDPWIMRLWDMAKQQSLAEFRIRTIEKREDLTALNYPVVAMTRTGSLVAASATLPDGKGVLVIWETATGTERYRFNYRATAVAFAWDGSLIAAGDNNGQVVLWSLSDGKEVAILEAGQAEILCLAFQRDYLRLDPTRQPNHAGATWLLASGDSGGNAVIWDLGRKQPRTFCHGSHYYVQTVAFNPDGTILASTGRAEVKLWDTASGRPILHLPHVTVGSGLAFSSEGMLLAVTNLTPGNRGAIQVWKLEDGRGSRTLRGLRTQIAHVRFSGDGRMLTALSHDWHVGVWELPSGRLRHVFEAPKGILADNADLAFSPDGSLLAMTTGRQAKLWEISSGREKQSWDLPPGLVDHLAFGHGSKMLALG